MATQKKTAAGAKALERSFLDADEQKLLALYSQLSDRNKARLIEHADDMLCAEKNTAEGAALTVIATSKRVSNLEAAKMLQNDFAFYAADELADATERLTGIEGLLEGMRLLAESNSVKPQEIALLIDQVRDINANLQTIEGAAAAEHTARTKAVCNA